MARLPSESESKTETPSPIVAAKPRPNPEQDAARFAGMLHRIDILIMIAVLAMAFMMASYTARNGDFWQHLAAGRLIAHGDYNFGKDPFSHATQGIYWTNHAWLFDLVLYGLYHLSENGAATVVFKAVLVTLVALFMLLACRPARSERIAPGSKVDPTGWLAAVLTAVALVAMSPRMDIRPAIVTYLFIGIAFWLLNRDRESSNAMRLAIPIGVLCAIWVNVDSWFILGPGLILLTLAGEAIQLVAPGEEKHRPGKARFRALVVALAAGSIGCLLSPHHIRAFTIPPEFADLRLAKSYLADPLIRGQFFHTYSEAFYRNSDLGGNQSGICLAVLLVGGILAFALNITHLRWSLVLTWVAMAALALWNWRLIPYFAVVAVPVTVQTVHAWLARRPSRFAEASSGSTRTQVSDMPDLPVAAETPAVALPQLPAPDGGGFAVTLSGLLAFFGLMARLFTFALALVALVACYPGWLHVTNANPVTDRHLSWAVEPNDANRDMAEQIPKWRESKLLPENARFFCYNPEVSYYIPWFAPGERSYFDFRYNVTAGLSDEFMRVRKGMADASKNSEYGDDWPGVDVLQRRGITHVILTKMESIESKRLLVWMLANQSQWTVWFLNGQTAVFAWRSPDKAAPPTPATLDPVQQAFGPEAKRLPAPTTGPGLIPATFEEVPRKRELLDRFLFPPPIPGRDSDVVDNYRLMYLVAVDQGVAKGRFLNDALSCAEAAGQVAIAQSPNWIPGFVNPGQVEVRFRAVSKSIQNEDDRTSAIALLTVRETWRAILTRPDQGYPYLALAKAYENWPAIGRELRDIQLSRLWHIGLAQATTEEIEHFGLQPYLTETYLSLLQKYYIKANPPLMDISAECLDQLFKTFKRYPPRNLTPEQVDKTEAQLRKIQAEIQEKLPTIKESYILKSEKRQPAEQAQIAFGHGLIREAVKVLESNWMTLDTSSKASLVKLYIVLGQGEDALAKLDQMMRESSRTEQETAFLRQTRIRRALISAGSFAVARSEMDATFSDIERARDSMGMRTDLVRAVGGLFANDPSGVNPIARGVAAITLGVPTAGNPSANAAIVGSLYRVQEMMGMVTDYHAMQAMLALEEGDTTAALKHLKAAVEPEGGPPIQFVGRPYAARYLEILKRQYPGK